MDRLTSKWIIVLFSLFILVIAQANATPFKAAGKGFWETNMRLCDVDANGHCHTAKYVLSISRFGTGGLALAILCLLALIVFLPVRLCCNGFGGRNPSYGFCPSKYEKRDYKRNEILSVKVASVLLLIPIAVAVGLGFQANSEISSSITNITNSLVASGDHIVLSLNETRGIVLQFTTNKNATSILNSAINTAMNIDNNLHNIHNKAHTYDNVRESLMIVGFICSVLMVVLGIICAIFNLRRIAMMLGVFALIGLTIVWLCFGIHFVGDKFVYDTCVDIDLLTSNSTESNTTSLFKTGALAKLWACDNNTELVQLEQLVDTSINTAASYACSLRAQVCYNETSKQGDPDFQCSTSPPCGRNTLTTVTDSQHMKILDGGQERSLQQCATMCVNAEYRNASATIVNALQMYTNYTNIYNNNILPILNCEVAADVLLEVKHPLCSNIFNSLYGVAITSLIVGIFYIPYVFFMIIGYKRFQSLDGGVV